MTLPLTLTLTLTPSPAGLEQYDDFDDYLEMVAPHPSPNPSPNPNPNLGVHPLLQGVASTLFG